MCPNIRGSIPNQFSIMAVARCSVDGANNLSSLASSAKRSFKFLTGWLARRLMKGRFYLSDYGSLEKRNSQLSV